MNAVDIICEYAEYIGCKVQKDAFMSEYTSFRTGGKADLLVSPKNEQTLIQLIKKCKTNEVTPFIMGNASNLLVSDNGMRGVVIHIAEGLSDLAYLGDGIVQCGAGISLSKLCHFALEHSLTGLEFAFGIPGSAGGAAFMNAGAYCGEMKDVIESCRHITPDGEIGILNGNNLDFSYRHSAYENNGCVITQLTLKLQPGNKKEIKEKMMDLMSRRKSKQPLEYPSAGSIFKRPEGYFAGRLIEESGLKGKTIGGAQVSMKHSGFIINVGGATTKDIEDLISFVQKTVFDRTGVVLETEVRRVG